MPTSNPIHMPTVIHFLTGIQPKSVLDIGIGMGAYGFLTRQYLDIARERVRKEDWKVIIDGIEIFEAYRNPVWDYSYNSVKIGNIEYVDIDYNYDLVICNDVLEHLDHDSALKVIDKIMKHTKVLIATTPNFFIEQGAWGGNYAETHRCLLKPKDFAKLAAYIYTGDTTCYICASDKLFRDQVSQIAQTCPKYKIPLRCWYNPRAIAGWILRKFGLIN
jgi:2-polyprenyl-3-methyl-5-hydroxy-6-metoxy-1,4-benzoquinol methylase